MKIKAKEIDLGYYPPWYYGVSYYDPEWDYLYFYIVPINTLIALVRDCFRFMKKWNILVSDEPIYTIYRDGVVVENGSNITLSNCIAYGNSENGIALNIKL